MNQYLAFKAHSFLAPGRRLSSHREVTQIYLDLFPQGVTTTSPQTLNFTDSTLPGMVGYKLSFHVDLIPEVYMLYLPFLSITHTQSKGLYQNYPVISATDPTTTKFPVLQSMEGTGKFPKIPTRRTTNNKKYLRLH